MRCATPWRRSASKSTRRPSARRRSFASCARADRYSTNKSKDRAAPVAQFSRRSINKPSRALSALANTLTTQRVRRENGNATTTSNSTRRPEPDAQFPQLGMAPNPRHDDLWRRHAAEPGGEPGGAANRRAGDRLDPGDDRDGSVRRPGAGPPEGPGHVRGHRGHRQFGNDAPGGDAVSTEAHGDGARPRRRGHHQTDAARRRASQGTGAQALPRS